MIMHPNAVFLGTAELNYEQWRDLLRPNWGIYTPDDPKSFVGRVRPRRIYGLDASDISGNGRRCERTQKDVRLDGVDHFYAVFQFAGRSTIIQDDQAVPLTAGDVTLIDSARPVTYLNGSHEQWLSLQLPRQPLMVHLGFEPQGCFRARSGLNVRASQRLYAACGLGSPRSTIRSVRSCALRPAYGKAIQTHLHHRQGSLC
jgi:AraC family transcriptional regulator, positive regulator of tynA and feaB